MKQFIRIISLVLFCFGPSSLFSQNTVSLDDCYEWARTNYPLIKNQGLLEESTQMMLNATSKANLPQLKINGQASYQSEVTAFPIQIPNLEVPTISKDQYKISGEVFQPLTGFSTVQSVKEEIKANGLVEQQKLEVELYQLKNRINQLYFGVLLLSSQDKTLDLAVQDMDSTMKKLDNAIKNGTATLMDKNLIAVERMHLDQQRTEIGLSKEAYLNMLSQFTGRSIPPSAMLEEPFSVKIDESKQRPEIQLFNLQQKKLDAMKTQINKRLIPNLGLFFQGGFGRPALNFLSNNFEPFYITGLRLNWDISKLYTSKDERRNVLVSQKIIDNNRQVFELNNSMEEAKQSAEIKKLEEQIKQDYKIVQLREQIKETAEIQLFEGVITTIDYVKILNDKNRATQSLRLHEIMLVQAQYQLKTILGN